MEAKLEKIKKKEPFIHITRKQNIVLSSKWKGRLYTIIIAFLICGLIALTAAGVSFGQYFSKMFQYNFGNKYIIVSFLNDASILLLISLALVPAFKMKFWNIGAEGQVMMGALFCAIMQNYLGGAMNLNNGFLRFIFFIVTIIMCILGGALWAFIPAFFKARFNTNETLFTLLMNYVAIQFVKMFSQIWSPQSGIAPKFNELTYLPRIGGDIGVYNIIIVAVLAIALFVYLKFSKHGYEIAVVGDSRNTANYVGINVKKVIIRTMILSGAICGIVGFLLIAGNDSSIGYNIVGGKGFTAVMIAWIGGLNPIEILFFALLATFISRGGSNLSSISAFGNILLGVVFFSLLICEFFVNYDVHCEKMRKFDEKVRQSKFGNGVYIAHCAVRKYIYLFIVKIITFFKFLFSKIKTLFVKKEEI